MISATGSQASSTRPNNSWLASINRCTFANPGFVMAEAPQAGHSIPATRSTHTRLSTKTRISTRFAAAPHLGHVGAMQGRTRVPKETGCGLRPEPIRQIHVPEATFPVDGMHAARLGAADAARALEEARLVRADLEASRAQAREWKARALAAEAERDALRSRVHELEGRLRFHEGPNAPPSRRLAKPNRAKPPGRKRGAPKGHRGATRTTPPIDATVDVEAARCPACGGHPGAPTGVDVRVITERPRPAPTTTTQYNLATYACRCGHAFAAPHPEVPREGAWGPLLLTHFTLLPFLVRGRLRRCAAFVLGQDGVPISVKGYWDALQRVGRACKSDYAVLWDAIRHAPYVYVDETSFKVQGKRWWLWTFRAPTGEVLVVIRKSRANGVVREILGDDPQPLVVDGHGAYEYARIIQRCWSHLLREADAAREAGPVGEAFADALYAVFARLRAALDARGEDRRTQKAAFDAELEALVEAYAADAGIAKAVGYLRGGLGSWTTCLLYPATEEAPAMEPTNNLSENAIREHAVVRKLIGSFHSPEGAENYQYVASLFATWRYQKKNPAHELVGVLRRNLCGGESGIIPPPQVAPTVGTGSS